MLLNQLQQQNQKLRQGMELVLDKSQTDDQLVDRLRVQLMEAQQKIKLLSKQRQSSTIIDQVCLCAYLRPC